MSDKPDGTGLTVDIVLRPEWAAVEAVDKILSVSLTPAVFGNPETVNYTVPAGKTLYIVRYTCAAFANAAADGDLNQIISVLLEDATAGTQFELLGVNGGGSSLLNKPIVIPSGHQFQGTIICRTNHTIGMRADFSGYEV